MGYIFTQIILELLEIMACSLWAGACELNQYHNIHTSTVLESLYFVDSNPAIIYGIIVLVIK